MKKNKLILIPTFFLLFYPLFTYNLALAVTTTETTINKAPSEVEIKALKEKVLKEVIAKIKTADETLTKNANIKKAEIEKKIADTKGEIKTKLETKSQEKVRATLESIFNKINVQIGKLSQVDMKISAKIAELEKAGVNVTNAKAQYNIAKQALDKTRIEILALKMTALDQITKETSKETLRGLVKQAEESMKATGKEYMKVVPLIAQIQNDKVVEANKTTSTN